MMYRKLPEVSPAKSCESSTEGLNENAPQQETKEDAFSEEESDDDLVRHSLIVGFAF
jgi:hypothetical protein